MTKTVYDNSSLSFRTRRYDILLDKNYREVINLLSALPILFYLNVLKTEEILQFWSTKFSTCVAHEVNAAFEFGRTYQKIKCRDRRSIQRTMGSEQISAPLPTKSNRSLCAQQPRGRGKMLARKTRDCKFFFLFFFFFGTQSAPISRRLAITKGGSIFNAATIYNQSSYIFRSRDHCVLFIKTKFQWNFPERKIKGRKNAIFAEIFARHARIFKHFHGIMKFHFEIIAIGLRASMRNVIWKFSNRHRPFLFADCTQIFNNIWNSPY